MSHLHTMYYQPQAPPPQQGAPHAQQPPPPQQVVRYMSASQATAGTSNMIYYSPAAPPSGSSPSHLIRRVTAAAPLPPPPPVNNGPPPTTCIIQWKEELSTTGLATCVHPGCRLSCLSLPGAVAHFRVCTGELREGHFIPCNICNRRFKHFRSMSTHRDKAHPQVVYAATGVPVNVQPIQAPQPAIRAKAEKPKHTYGRQREPSPPRPNYLPPDLDDEVTKYQNSRNKSEGERSDLHQRIMAESKMISNPRKSGRPSKGAMRRPGIENFQYRNTFDVDESTGPNETIVSNPGAAVTIIQHSTPLKPQPVYEPLVEQSQPPQPQYQLVEIHSDSLYAQQPQPQNLVIATPSAPNVVHLTPDEYAKLQAQQQQVPRLPQQFVQTVVSSPQILQAEEKPPLFLATSHSQFAPLTQTVTHSVPPGSVSIQGPRQPHPVPISMFNALRPSMTSTPTRRASVNSVPTLLPSQPMPQVPGPSSFSSPVNPVPGSSRASLVSDVSSSNVDSSVARAPMPPAPAVKESSSAPKLEPGANAEPGKEENEDEDNEDDDLEEMERKLAEKEKQLADYARLVEESERMAKQAKKDAVKEAKKKAIRERQAKMREQEELLKKRLQVAVKDLEDHKPSIDEQGQIDTGKTSDLEESGAHRFPTPGSSTTSLQHPTSSGQIDDSGLSDQSRASSVLTSVSAIAPRAGPSPSQARANIDLATLNEATFQLEKSKRSEVERPESPVKLSVPDDPPAEPTQEPKSPSPVSVIEDLPAEKEDVSPLTVTPVSTCSSLKSKERGKRVHIPKPLFLDSETENSKLKVLLPEGADATVLPNSANEKPVDEKVDEAIKAVVLPPAANTQLVQIVRQEVTPEGETIETVSEEVLPVVLESELMKLSPGAKLVEIPTQGFAETVVLEEKVQPAQIQPEPTRAAKKAAADSKPALDDNGIVANDTDTAPSVDATPQRMRTRARILGKSKPKVPAAAGAGGKGRLQMSVSPAPVPVPPAVLLEAEEPSAESLGQSSLEKEPKEVPNLIKDLNERNQRILATRAKPLTPRKAKKATPNFPRSRQDIAMKIDEIIEQQEREEEEERAKNDKSKWIEPSGNDDGKVKVTNANNAREETEDVTDNEVAEVEQPPKQDEAKTDQDGKNLGTVYDSDQDMFVDTDENDSGDAEVTKEQVGDCNASKTGSDTSDTIFGKSTPERNTEQTISEKAEEAFAFTENDTNEVKSTIDKLEDHLNRQTARKTKSISTVNKGGSRRKKDKANEEELNSKESSIPEKKSPSTPAKKDDPPLTSKRSRRKSKDVSEAQPSKKRRSEATSPKLEPTGVSSGALPIRSSNRKRKSTKKVQEQIADAEVKGVEKENQTPRSKRLRKRKEIENETPPAQTEREEDEKPLVKPEKKRRKQRELACGACDAVIIGPAKFGVHVASVHFGLARLKGEKQTFTEEEKTEAAREAFNFGVPVPCYRCEGQRDFQTWPGLKYHLATCNRTEEELEKIKQKCRHCDYRGLQSNLRIHEQRHRREIERQEKERAAAEEEKSYEVENLSEGETSGRRRRRAATKASERVAAAITALKSKEEGEASDIEPNESDDEDAFNVNKEMDLSPHYERVSKANFRCKLCQKAEFESIKSVEGHIVADHPDDLNPNEEDDENYEDLDENFEDDSSVADSDDDYDGSVIRFNSSPRKGGCGRSDRPSVLEPTVSFFPLESNFRKANFNKERFRDFHTKYEDWEIFTSEKVVEYLPSSETSVEFITRNIRNKDESCEPVGLNRFSSTVDGDAGVLFAGGPIWAMDWCPGGSLGDKDGVYFALSTQEEGEDNGVNLKCGNAELNRKGLIQIWKYDKMTRSTRLALAIPHEFGRIWRMKWAPSGGYAEKDGDSLERIGLLACAFSDGSVRIFSVPKPEALSAQDSPVFARVAPKLSLKTRGCETADPFQCLGLAWYRGRGHRVIAAGYSDGFFAVFDILTPEANMLQREGDIIYPYLHVQGHSSSVTCIDLGVDSSVVEQREFPTRLVTGSSDRLCAVWDLARPHIPVQSVKRGFITDATWLDHYPGSVLLSFDDVFLQSHTQSLIFEFSLGRSRTAPIMAHNSGVWRQSYNPWINSMVTSTCGGEVVLFVAPTLGKALEHDKDSNRRRICLFKTEEVARESDGKKMLRFVDVPTENFKSLTPVEQRNARNIELMSMEDITQPPLTSVNRVSQNVDLDNLGLVFSGGQSGLARIHHIKSVNNPQVKSAVKTLK